MTPALDSFIVRFAGLKTTLILLVVFLAFNFAIFPQYMPEDETLQPLDLQFAYTPQQAYSLIEQYSPVDKQNYKFTEYTVDVIYPLVYTLLFSFALYLLFKSVKLAKLPFLILIADYLENIGIYNILKAYPEELNELVWLTSTVTSIKWILAIIAVVIILFGLFYKIKKLVF
jgi:hypothetical protein